MNNSEAQALLDKIIGQVFGYKNTYTLEQFQQKFAFDVRLPMKVNDSITGEETWAQSISTGKYITIDNARKMGEKGAFEQPKQAINTVVELLKAWEKVNYTTTERQVDSLNVFESDSVMESENVFRSMDIRKSKNVLFCDGVNHSEYVVASQRSGTIQYCIRVDDSRNCTNSFTVAWSNKIVNSIFISDCFDMYECMFCYNMASKKFHIANMPFEEKEYYKIKDMVVRWILSQ